MRKKKNNTERSIMMVCVYLYVRVNKKFRGEKEWTNETSKQTNSKSGREETENRFCFCVTNDRILNIQYINFIQIRSECNEIQRPMFNVIHAHIISIHKREFAYITSHHITYHRLLLRVYVYVCVCIDGMLYRTHSVMVNVNFFLLLLSSCIYLYTAPHTS